MLIDSVSAFKFDMVVDKDINYHLAEDSKEKKEEEEEKAFAFDPEKEREFRAKFEQVEKEKWQQAVQEEPDLLYDQPILEVKTQRRRYKKVRKRKKRSKSGVHKITRETDSDVKDDYQKEEKEAYKKDENVNEESVKNLIADLMSDNIGSVSNQNKPLSKSADALNSNKRKNKRNFVDSSSTFLITKE
eukprot:TRINITY_DN1349_c0_g2_i1.p1 TRINITY_DN1349_c0_g2~~TRINITY_DN1349_c0_g2_i1.p1  ORF type:complete len:188 (+),score=73.11 TRINITY_DN1349_c0_g2_i1:536-1099(+)